MELYELLNKAQLMLGSVIWPPVSLTPPPALFPPDSLREALRRCFDRLPEEFDATQALRLVDSIYPQFRERDRTTRSQAVSAVAAEKGAMALGAFGANRSLKFRKLPPDNGWPETIR